MLLRSLTKNQDVTDNATKELRNDVRVIIIVKETGRERRVEQIGDDGPRPDFGTNMFTENVIQLHTIMLHCY